MEIVSIVITGLVSAVGGFLINFLGKQDKSWVELA